MGSSCSCATTAIPHIRLTLKKEDVRARARARSCAGHVSTTLGVDKARVELSLNEKEIITVMRSWEVIRQDITGNGQKMFCKMFESSPDVRAYFEKFSGISSNSSLWESDVLQIHGMAVMTAVDEIMCSLDDFDVVIELVLEQGQSHAYFGNLTEKIFWAIEQPFLETVKEALKSKYTKHLHSVYEKTIKCVIDLFVMGFQKGKTVQEKGNGVLGWSLPSNVIPRSTVSMRTTLSIGNTSLP